MGQSARNNRDKEMAAHMKKLGIRRKWARCPICHKTVSLNKLYIHIVLHS